MISTMIRPSGSSASTVRCSRAQRACSAEISTRATREPPIRARCAASRRCRRSGSGPRAARSAPSAPTARLMRSSRKCCSRPRSRSQAATYQASRAVEQRVGLDDALGVAVLGLGPVLELEQPVLVHRQLDRVRDVVVHDRGDDVQALLDRVEAERVDDLLARGAQLGVGEPDQVDRRDQRLGLDRQQPRRAVERVRVRLRVDLDLARTAAPRRRSRTRRRRS